MSLSASLVLSGISFPAFALGILLMEVLAVELGWLPSVGAATWKHYILPSITLGAAVAAVMARFTRASFVEVLSNDYIRTARAKGVSGAGIVMKHALRNALIPVVTMMGVCVLRVLWVCFVFPLDRTMENLMLSYPVSWALTAAVNGYLLYRVCRKLFATSGRHYINLPLAESSLR